MQSHYSLLISQFEGLNESCICGVEEMAAIEEVNLAAHHEARWRFRDRSDTLPGGRIVLTVTDGSGWWKFECKNERDDVYCISGSEWRRFAGSRMDALVTLYSKEEAEDFHRIRVRVDSLSV